MDPKEPTIFKTVALNRSANLPKRVLLQKEDIYNRKEFYYVKEL